MKTIFDVLRDEKCTTFKIRYNHKADKYHLNLLKEWDESIDFSKYNEEFISLDILSDNTIDYNTEETLELLSRVGAMSYFESIMELIKQGKTVAVDMYYFAKYNIKFTMYEHSLIRGLRNKSHAVMCGGIRRHIPEKDELEVFTDGNNLGRAMSFKNLAAALPFGGCKATVQMDVLDVENKEIMGFIGFAIDKCRVLMAPDMNYPAEMSDKLQEYGFTKQCVGGVNASTGPTGKPTAYGVFLSLKEAVKFNEGIDSLEGKEVALMGLGAVGYNMAKYLLADGAKLTVADTNPMAVKNLLMEYPNHEIKTVPVDEILFQPVDILSPCAVGGVLSRDEIERLNCKYVWGSANNQLRAKNQAEEYELAGMLAAKGILYQAEWWSNTGGIICMAEEYFNNSCEEEVLERIAKTVPAATLENLKEARKKGITPTECAYKKCEAIIYA